jgi:hypothetical protein
MFFQSRDFIDLFQQILTMAFSELVDSVRQWLLFLLCTYMAYLIYTLLKDLLPSKPNRKRNGVVLKRKPVGVPAEEKPAPVISVTEVKDPEPAPVTKPNGKMTFDIEIQEVNEPVAPVTPAAKAEASGKSRRRTKGDVEVQSTSAAPGALQAAPEGTADAPNYKTLSRKCKHGKEKSKTMLYQIPPKPTAPAPLLKEWKN